MANYSYNDISYMTTKELKAHCIDKCKELGKPRSWVQTATNDERKQFLRDGNAPNGGEPQSQLCRHLVAVLALRSLRLVAWKK